MGAVGLSLLVLGLGAGTHPSWTRRGYAGRVMSPLATARRLEMPLFDPLSDELPFPFPPPPLAPDTPTSHSPPVLRFTFDRPMYRRLMTAADESEQKLFGHCIALDDDSASVDESSALSLIPRGLAKQGAIGVAVRIMELEAPPPDDPLILEESGATEPPTSARVVGAFRMRVEEIVSSFPFATAIVSPFSDEPPADEAQHRQTEKLEAEVTAALERLCDLSASIESFGDEVGAALAAEMLATPANLLQAHRQRVDGDEYESLTARWEHFSLALCSIVDLDHDDAVEAIRTTSGAKRFTLLLTKLREALGEMDTLAALDEAAAWRGGGVGAAAADPAASAVLGGNFSPIDIPVGDAPDADLDSAVARPGAEAQFSEVPEGTRLEYWWNEEWGWCAATVVGKLRPLNGKLVHALQFDSDGSVEDCSLYFDDGGRRWRPIRPV